MKRSLSVLGLAGSLVAGNVHALSIAVFGDNAIDDFLDANGHSATVVTDADLATAGFLDPFDLIIYTRDGDSFGTSLSGAAASGVSAFVTGNVVLFASDLADNGFPGDATNTLMLNAVAFTGNKGFIGEFNGSCAAMGSNNQGLAALGLVAGSCSGLGYGPGGDPMDILLNAHPVVAGVPDPVSLGNSHEYFALLIGSAPAQLVAINSALNPSIVASAVPEPDSFVLLGLGLAGFFFGRRGTRG